MNKNIIIAIGAIGAIIMHLWLRFWGVTDETLFGIETAQFPLLIILVLGGFPLVYELLQKVMRQQFGSDLLAGISIVTALFFDEYLAGAIVVLMLSGGETLEIYAVRRASSILEALAKRMPTIAHRKINEQITDIAITEIKINETLVVYPHELCPVDGTVIAGHGVMDESFLTGEPYMLSKTPGSTVISGAINGDSSLTMRVDKLPIDSRYAKIMEVMRASAQQRPRIRRLGDRLGAWYGPLAVAIAIAAWVLSGEKHRFLAVLVVATPCPLILAIPIAIIGSISLSARRGIIIKDPVVLEKVVDCRTAIFDKTGTLTYAKPVLTTINPAPDFTANEVLQIVASLERYSKHPLAGAILEAAEYAQLPLIEAEQIREIPGAGLHGIINGSEITITSRKKLTQKGLDVPPALGKDTGGLECIVVINNEIAASIHFHDESRKEGAPFIKHLTPKHKFRRLILLSGDRESEVRYLANEVGIKEVYFEKSPEEKLAIVRQETSLADTIFLGDGINDAPALSAATVGVAFGHNSEITAEAAGAVIMDSSLEKVDEFIHISQRMRRIALQSAIGGMLLSFVGMIAAAFGYLSPVAGAVTQEIIDVAAILNALRAAIPPKQLKDYE